MRRNNKSPFFSVIIPFYNSPKISVAVSSALHQTWKDFEIVIADDSASDGKLLQSFLAPNVLEDERVLVIQNSKNLGLTRSLNTSIRRSNGKIIVRLDDDDEMMPKRLELLAQHFTDGHEFVGTNSMIRLNSVARSNIVPGSKMMNKQILSTLLDSRAACTHSAFAFTRQIFDQISGYDEAFTYAQDRDFLLRLVASSNKAIVIPDVLTVVNVEPNSISNSSSHEDQIAYGLIAQAIHKRSAKGLKSDATTLLSIIKERFLWRLILQIEKLKRNLRLMKPMWRFFHLLNPPNLVVLAMAPLNRQLKNILVDRLTRR